MKKKAYLKAVGESKLKRHGGRPGRMYQYCVKCHHAVRSLPRHNRRKHK